MNNFEQIKQQKMDSIKPKRSSAIVKARDTKLKSIYRSVDKDGQAWIVTRHGNVLSKVPCDREEDVITKIFRDMKAKKQSLIHAILRRKGIVTQEDQDNLEEVARNLGITTIELAASSSRKARKSSNRIEPTKLSDSILDRIRQITMEK